MAYGKSLEPKRPLNVELYHVSSAYTDGKVVPSTLKYIDRQAYRREMIKIRRLTQRSKRHARREKEAE